MGFPEKRGLCEFDVSQLCQNGCASFGTVACSRKTLHWTPVLDSVSPVLPRFCLGTDLERQNRRFPYDHWEAGPFARSLERAAWSWFYCRSRDVRLACRVTFRRG